MPRMKRIIVYTVDGCRFAWSEHADNMWDSINPQDIESVEQVISYTREEWLNEPPPALDAAL